MKKQLMLGVACVIMVLPAVGAPNANSEMPSDAGVRFAKAALGLVSFAELLNIGARDPACKQTAFPTTDIHHLIESQIVPIMNTMARLEGKSATGLTNKAVKLLEQMSSVEQNGINVLKKTYYKMKRNAAAAYGGDKACAVVSAMLQTVVQQKRLQLNNIRSALRYAESN